MNDREINGREMDYRAQFAFDVLKKYGRTNFESLADFGCGDGRVLRSLMNKVGASKALGVDLNAREELSTSTITFEKADLIQYSPRDQYDLVISNQVFEHIYEPWLASYFDVLKGSCRPGGTILVSTPNRWRPRNIFRAISLRKPLMMSPNPGVPPEEHRGHHRECNYRELAQIFTEFFPQPDWRVQIARPTPRRIGSTPRLILNLSIYYLLWWAWRPLCVSASHDHYVVVQRSLTAS